MTLKCMLGIQEVKRLRGYSLHNVMMIITATAQKCCYRCNDHRTLVKTPGMPLWLVSYGNTGGKSLLRN